MKIKRKAVLAEDKVKRSLIRAGAKLGFRKCKSLTEGPSRDMTNFKSTPKFERIFEDEKKAVRAWMASGKGKSYLDVGAGDGRMAKLAIETGASHVTAIDIVDECIAALKKIPGVDVRKMNALEVDIEEKFDRVMVLGNTLAGMYDEWHGGEKSFQVELLRKLFAVTREELCLTFHSPESLRTMLAVYRGNNWRFYGYDDETGVKRMKYITPEGERIEFRSQHFALSEVQTLLAKAGIRDYQIKSINGMQWMVIAKKAPGGI